MFEKAANIKVNNNELRYMFKREQKHVILITYKFTRNWFVKHRDLENG